MRSAGFENPALFCYYINMAPYIMNQQEWDELIAKFNCKWLQTFDFGYIYAKAECLKCKHQFKITGHTLKTRKRDTVCPECLGQNSFGGKINPNRHGYLYLMVNSYGYMKVGITSIPIHYSNGRVAAHERHGWQLYKFWTFENGDQAYKAERFVLNWWRKELNVPVACKGIDGWTETANVKDVSVQSTCDKIESFKADDFVSKLSAA